MKFFLYATSKTRRNRQGYNNDDDQKKKMRNKVVENYV